MRKKRRIMAMLMAMAMILSSLIPSTEAMAAEPNHVSSETEAKAPSLRILFSAEYYAQNNPDVYAAFGDDANLLYQHYVNYGIPEGRQYLTPILDVRAYRAGNPDLEKAFGDDWEKYLWHFMNYGAQEIAMSLRAPKGLIFDAVKYLQANPDVRRVVGNDLLAAMQHYISSGRPVGVWVSAKYTAGPAVVSQTSSSSNVSNVTSNSSNSNNGGSSSSNHGGDSGNHGGDSGNHGGDSGNHGGDSGNNGGDSGNNGGSSKPNPAPDKPGINLPGTDPEQPDEPDGPVQPAHSKDSLHVKEDFGEDGKCTQGCGLTLVDFQQACKMDHSAIEIGHFCVVCGAEGTNNPTEEHTKDSLHTKNSFDENGLCLRGCGLTLEEFQNNCTENHELHLGQTCANCGYAGMIPYTKEECPNKANHTYGEACNFCDYAGECMEDHSVIYTTKVCEVCGEHGTKVCEVDHTEIFVDAFCPECGAEGTKPKPEVCENEANHAALHKGQTCPGCGYVGEADHTWDKTTGECTGCDVKCPNINDHADILQGETCEICGYEGTKEPTVIEHPDGYTHSLADFIGGKCGICGMTVDEFQAACTSDEHETLKATGGTCSVCGKQIEKEEVPFVCPNESNHGSLHKGVICEAEGCDYVGEADHVFVEGKCECGAEDPDYEESCTDADHAADKLACGEGCPNCDYVAPAHAYNDGECTRCGEPCPNDSNVACGEQCAICQWIAPSHSYNNSENAGYCARCGQECSHAFSNGTCAHCGIPDPSYCGNDFHYHCDSEGVCPDCGRSTKPDHVFVDGKCNDCGAEDPDYVKPVHEHIWSGGVCSGEGECPGCPNASGHGDIPATATCDTCGAAGTKPVYAYTPNDGKHTCDYVDNVCTFCGGQKVGFGSSEEELDDEGDAGGEPAASGGAGSAAAGGNSGNEDGTDAQNGLPESLPVDVIVVTEQHNNTEPEPEDEDEDDTEGGGEPADEDEEEDSEQSSEQST